MIGMLHMDIPTCIMTYANVAPKIFSPKIIGDSIRYVRTGHAFSSEPFEQEVKELVNIFLNKGTDVDMNYDIERLSKVALCTSRVSPHACVEPCRLRSYSKGDDDVSCHIWQACLATSAVPVLFPSVVLGNPPNEYVDGGLLHNNPIFAAYNEASNLSAPIGCLVSVGTGAGNPSYDSGITGFTKWCFGAATSTELTAALFDDAKANELSGRYFRFNSTGIEDVKLQDITQIDKIRVETEKYVLSEHDNLQKCANLLHTIKKSDSQVQGQAPVPFTEEEKMTLEKAQRILEQMNQAEAIIQDAKVQIYGYATQVGGSGQLAAAEKNKTYQEKVYIPELKRVDSGIEFIEEKCGPTSTPVIAAKVSKANLQQLTFDNSGAEDLKNIMQKLDLTQPAAIEKKAYIEANLRQFEEQKEMIDEWKAQPSKSVDINQLPIPDAEGANLVKKKVLEVRTAWVEPVEELFGDNSPVTIQAKGKLAVVPPKPGTPPPDFGAMEETYSESCGRLEQNIDRNVSHCPN